MEDLNAFIDSTDDDTPSTMLSNENRRGALAQMKGTRTKASGSEGGGGLTSNEINMSFANWSIADNASWTCSLCTYLNDNPRHLTCAACGTTRNEGKASSTSEGDIIADEPRNAHTAATSVNEGGKESLAEITEEGTQGEAQDEYEAALLEERLQEHIAMQQEMLDEIQREREENDRKMEELRAYQQRILEKVEQDKAVQDKIDEDCNDVTCPATDPTNESLGARDEEEHVVQDYRRHLLEQKRTLEESSRHLQSVSRLGLVKLKLPGSGKQGSLLRDVSDFESKQGKSSKEEQVAMQNMKNEWMRREEQLRALRNQMRTRLELEEAKLTNTAA